MEYRKDLSREEETERRTQGNEAGAPHWMDAPFVQRVLDAEGSDLVAESVHVREAGGDVGEHHMSRVFKVSVTMVSRDQFLPTAGSANFDPAPAGRSQRRHMVLKTLPAGAAAREKVQQLGFFDNEQRMLGDVLPRVQAAVEARSRGRFRPLWARCLLRGDDPHPFILMEDISHAGGFRLVEAGRGLGLRHSLVALRELARFHAASRVLLETPGEAETLAARPDGSASDDPDAFIEEELRVVAREMSGWKGVPADLGQRLEELAPVVARRFQAAFAPLPQPHDFCVLAHGDFWLNNLLFSYDDEGRPVNARAVDWQASRLAAPAVDLHYFLHTSLSDDVSRHHEDLLVREYHAELSAELLRLGCARRPSLRQLRAQMDACGAWGLFAAVHILPLVKKPPGSCYNLDDSVRDPNMHAALYREPAYQRCMRRFLPRFLALGLLDP